MRERQARIFGKLLIVGWGAVLCAVGGTVAVGWLAARAIGRLRK